jgi:protein-S-isoprenylcysteine O-methyltransferase Ste14
MQIQLIILGSYFALTSFLWYTVFSGKFKWSWPVCGPLTSILPFLMVFPEQPRFELDFFWWRVAGLVAIALGVAVYIWAVYEFKKVGWEEGKKLVDTGPFQFVRHPMYLGTIFVYVGWWWAWAAVYAFYLGMIILAAIWFQAYLEEKIFLEKTFGDKYVEYRRKTGMFWIK